jgi:hypothetical protein
LLPFLMAMASRMPLLVLLLRYLGFYYWHSDRLTRIRNLAQSGQRALNDSTLCMAAA